MSHGKLDPETHEELLAAFSQFDRNGDGTIDRAELAQIFEALDAGMSPDEVAVGMSVIDRNENGRISFAEFVAWWTDR